MVDFYEIGDADSHAWQVSTTRPAMCWLPLNSNHLILPKVWFVTVQTTWKKLVPVTRLVFAETCLHFS